MIDGAKHEIEGVNHDTDRAKCQALSKACQVVKHFAVYLSHT